MPYCCIPQPAVAAAAAPSAAYARCQAEEQNQEAARVPARKARAPLPQQAHSPGTPLHRRAQTPAGTQDLVTNWL